MPGVGGAAWLCAGEETLEEMRWWTRAAGLFCGAMRGGSVPAPLVLPYGLRYGGGEGVARACWAWRAGANSELSKEHEMLRTLHLWQR